MVYGEKVSKSEERGIIMQVQFGEWTCELEFGYYWNGQTAIIFNDVEDGERVAVATVCIDEELEENEVAIKDYSENVGMLDALMEAGVVSAPKRYVRSGFVEIPICDLLVREE